MNDDKGQKGQSDKGWNPAEKGWTPPPSGNGEDKGASPPSGVTPPTPPTGHGAPNTFSSPSGDGADKGASPPSGTPPTGV